MPLGLGVVTILHTPPQCLSLNSQYDIQICYEWHADIIIKLLFHCLTHPG